MAKEGPYFERHMEKCDLAFCGGGTTLMELAFLGKPVVALPQHEMERKFISEFESVGYLIPGTEYCIKNMEKEPCMAIFQNGVLREKMARSGQKAIDGKGIDRIRNILLAAERS